MLSASAGGRLNASLAPQIAVTLPETGHLAMIEDPAPITQAIQAAAASPRLAR